MYSDSQLERSKMYRFRCPTGCPLSPVLLNLYLNDMIHSWKEQASKGILISDIYVYCLLFADDMATLAESKDELQYNILQLCKVAEQYNAKSQLLKPRFLVYMEGSLL